MVIQDFAVKTVFFGYRAARAVSQLVYVVSTMVKPVFGIGLNYLFSDGTNSVFQQVTSAGLYRTQSVFKLAEGQFDLYQVIVRIIGARR